MKLSSCFFLNLLTYFFIWKLLNFICNIQVAARLKPWSQRPTGLNSTQLIWLSWLGSPVITTRDSTQLVQFSQVLWFWTFGYVSSWVELSRSNDHSARSNSTQLNQVSFQSRSSFLFHRVGKVNNKNNFHLFKHHALLCNAMQRCTKLIETIYLLRNYTTPMTSDQRNHSVLGVGRRWYKFYNWVVELVVRQAVLVRYREQIVQQ